MKVKLSWPGDSWDWALSWHPIFCINLIVPLVLASMVLEDRGRVGMSCGIAFYWVLGFLVCAVRPFLGRVLVTGGVIVASTQMMPVLQVAAGLAATHLGHRFEKQSPEVCGFIEVIITGGLLLLAAFCSGRLLVSSEDWEREQDRPASSPDRSLSESIL